MTALLVLLLISVTLGLSYAAIRSQLMVSRIQQNALRRNDARHAAVTGLTIALKKMHTDAWAGVDTTLTGDLNDYERFEVTYATGDASLREGDEEWSEYPYRVTLTATGYAEDYTGSGAVSTYRVCAVVRLIPRAVADPPGSVSQTDWEAMGDYTVYQHAAGTFELSVPCRFEGPVRAQQEIEYGDEYAWSDDVRDQYWSDLENLRQAAKTDWRPFDGPLHLPFDEQNGYRAGSTSFFEDQMGWKLADTPEASAGLSFPSGWTTYRLYPGGKQYSAEPLRSRLENVGYEPDMLTNPLGLFYRTGGSMDLYDNVTIRGTIVGEGSWDGDIHLRGTNIVIQPTELPALAGSSKPIRLPAMIIEDDFRVHDGADVALSGVVFCNDDFEARATDQADVAFRLAGRLLARNIMVDGRNEWGDQTHGWWQALHNAYKTQEGDEGGIANFVVYLAKFTGLNPEPQITIVAEETEADDRWPDFSQPIYVPGSADDDGLRWDLIEWTENP